MNAIFCFTYQFLNILEGLKTENGFQPDTDSVTEDTLNKGTLSITSVTPSVIRRGLCTVRDGGNASHFIQG